MNDLLNNYRWTIIILCFAWHTTFAQSTNSNTHKLFVNQSLKPFYHGVASGDPLTDRVILWTRVTPDTGSIAPIIVNWKIAIDTGITQIVNSGSVITDISLDYTVKIDATGLQPNTYYYYEFNALGNNSIRGRTKTAPSGDVDSLRFAIVSCVNFEAGYFNAFRILKERNDVDVIILPGDYIYEYGTGEYPETPTPIRVVDPQNEIITLEDYRMRYSQYHLDEDLLRLHQQYPWMIVWDDHESADNSWKNGAGNHDPFTEGSWGARKAVAMQAFFEWLPIRKPEPINDPTRIFRTIKYGDLCNLYFLDTRLYGRDQQDGTSNFDTARTMLGSVQLDWLKNQLIANTSQWNIIVQQVMLAPLEMFGVPVNEDQWDGYPAEREKIYNHILNNNINNIVVITGDIHTSWANDLPTGNYDSQTGAGSVGVEFVVPSVTSPSGLTFGVTAIKAANDHIKYVDLTEKGFVIVDINKNRTQADWYYTYVITLPSNQFFYNASWYVNDNERFLREGIAASIPRASLQSSIQAPEMPRQENQTSILKKQNPIILFSAYPNPFSDYIHIQYYLNNTMDGVKLRLINIEGKTVYEELIGKQQQGLYRHKLIVGDISPGVYMLQIENNNNEVKYKLIKQ